MSSPPLRLRKVSGVLLDLSGTLHIENTPTPRAVYALKRLRDVNLSVRFITNTSKESKSLLLSRLTEMGFELRQDELFTSLTAARKIVEERSLRPLFLLEDVALEDFKDLRSSSKDESPNCVVVGLAPSCFGYKQINHAFRLLMEGAELIAVHKAKYYKQADGLSLGPGPFVEALEYASGVKAQIVGKPQPAFFHSVLKDLKCVAEETVMIGDDVLNDIQGAQTIGMKGILVKTGKYRHGDENTVDPSPFATCTNFAEATELVISMLQHVQ